MKLIGSRAYDSSRVSARGGSAQKLYKNFPVPDAALGSALRAWRFTYDDRGDSSDDIVDDRRVEHDIRASLPAAGPVVIRHRPTACAAKWLGGAVMAERIDGKSPPWISPLISHHHLLAHELWVTSLRDNAIHASQRDKAEKLSWRALMRHAGHRHVCTLVKIRKVNVLKIMSFFNDAAGRRPRHHRLRIETSVVVREALLASAIADRRPLWKLAAPLQARDWPRLITMRETARRPDEFTWLMSVQIEWHR